MSYISSELIRSARERKKLTQAALAQTLHISDKTVSKWETVRGLPDIAILPELAQALQVSVPELLTGVCAQNQNTAGNMHRSRFYVCPVCGNVIHAMGEGSFSCHGIQLPLLEPEEGNPEHALKTEMVDGEYYVTMDHPMTKTHYISFAAYVTTDTLYLTKLYPEQDMAVRFPKRGRGELYVYCNRHGLFRAAL